MNRSTKASIILDPPWPFDVRQEIYKLDPRGEFLAQPGSSGTAAAEPETDFGSTPNHAS